MTNPTQKKLSRRDAIKLLGAAAGASVLVNLPSKWSTPQLASGVLPAHAQTSLCWSCYVEVLSADGFIAAGPIGPGPKPDFISGQGEAGTQLGWVCQIGCLPFYVALLGATTASIQITTISNQFTLNLNLNNPVYDILIDLGTGDYSLNFQGTAGGCDWPVNPKQDRNNGGYWNK